MLGHYYITPRHYTRSKDIIDFSMILLIPFTYTHTWLTEYIPRVIIAYIVGRLYKNNTF